MRKYLGLGMLAMILMNAPVSRAITVASGPSFTPATNAPLAGLLQVSTDVNSRVSVTVNDGVTNWTRDFYDFGTTHSEILVGFKPGRSNQIQVTCYDQERNATTSEPLAFTTASLNPNFPVSVVFTNQPDAMEPGYTLYILQQNNVGAYVTLMDNSGNVVWYKPWTTHDFDVRQLDDGNLFIEQASPSNNFVEVDLLGNTVRTWTGATGYPLNEHDGVPTAHGTILYVSDVSETVSNFPSSIATNAPLVTKKIDDNPVVEISASNSALVNAWSPMDILDPTRITYLSLQTPDAFGVDNEHANAVIEDTNEDALIVSERNQNTVYKFSRANGQLIWILGPPDNWGADWQPNLLTPQGTPFDWNYGQHAPSLTPQHTLLVYNDGNYRACPPAPQVADANNYSSAEEFSIDETNMTVTEVWNSAWQTNQDRLFTGVVGMAQWLPKTQHVLVTYGAVAYVNGLQTNPNQASSTMVRIKEYTHDPVPQVVFDLCIYQNGNTSPSYFGNLCYRSRRIPDLYPHPAAPVVDMNISWQGQMPAVQFSADPTHTYLIQSSTDLVHWTTIGAPVQEAGTGDYDFTDTNEGQSACNFYRIVTN